MEERNISKYYEEQFTRFLLKRQELFEIENFINN